MVENHFYNDWQFWSTIVAGLALGLSQLAPILTWFRRGKLSCETFTRMHITHKVGNPNVQWHLIIENTGGKAIRIKAITLSFKKNDGTEFELPAQSYLRNPESTESVMFTPFRLKSGEEWAHVLNFFSLFSRDDEKEYRLLESKIRSDISLQKENLYNNEKMCEANQDAVNLIITFFQHHFKWIAGEYELILKIKTDNPKANLEHFYRFSLFESESNELRNYSKEYRYGAGVYWNSPTQTGLNIPLHER
jgi:hypothetical protein